MAKNTLIESYIAYQKSTDKSPMTLSSYRSDLIQFAIWFESVNKEDMRLTNITPTDARQYKRHLCEELGISKQTLYRHLSPNGELREDGKKLLGIEL